MKDRFLILLLAPLLLFVATPELQAQTPNWRATPLYGSVNLQSGFSPDPHSVGLTAGGNDRNPISGTGCVGYIHSGAPDYNVSYRAGNVFDLYIYAESTVDTALLVYGPDGRWYCNDDGLGNLDPLLRFQNPASGVYSVWVATFRADNESAATLFVSELNPLERTTSTNTSSTVPCIGCEPYSGTLNLSAGFRPDPIVQRVAAGGQTRNPIQGSECRGYIDMGAPDVNLQYRAGSLPLSIYVESNIDTTLLINAPDGQWYCDDDGGRGLNPLLVFSRPQSGVYNIWVGTYTASNRGTDARIFVTELTAPR
ncbi:hypothetical protein BH23BAC4_BH23BAC4_14480 [soil metagenome]